LVLVLFLAFSALSAAFSSAGKKICFGFPSKSSGPLDFLHLKHSFLPLKL
jgi:hypothetical protein